MTVSDREKLRALRTLDDHNGTAKVSNHTSQRGGLVDWTVLGVLMNDGLAFRRTGVDLHTTYGITSDGKERLLEMQL